MIAMVHEFHHCRSFHEKALIIIIYTLFSGIDTPKGVNETLITVQYHTHPFIAAPISWGQGKLISMCRELNSTGLNRLLRLKQQRFA